MAEPKCDGTRAHRTAPPVFGFGHDGPDELQLVQSSAATTTAAPRRHKTATAHKQSRHQSFADVLAGCSTVSFRSSSTSTPRSLRRERRRKSRRSRSKKARKKDRRLAKTSQHWDGPAPSASPQREQPNASSSPTAVGGRASATVCDPLFPDAHLLQHQQKPRDNAAKSTSSMDLRGLSLLHSRDSADAPRLSAASWGSLQHYDPGELPATTSKGGAWSRVSRQSLLDALNRQSMTLESITSLMEHVDAYDGLERVGVTRDSDPASVLGPHERHAATGPHTLPREGSTPPRSRTSQMSLGDMLFPAHTAGSVRRRSTTFSAHPWPSSRPSATASFGIPMHADSLWSVDDAAEHGEHGGHVGHGRGSPAPTLDAWPPTQTPAALTTGHQSTDGGLGTTNTQHAPSSVRAHKARRVGRRGPGDASAVAGAAGTVVVDVTTGVNPDSFPPAAIADAQSGLGSGVAAVVRAAATGNVVAATGSRPNKRPRRTITRVRGSKPAVGPKSAQLLSRIGDAPPCQSLPAASSAPPQGSDRLQAMMASIDALVGLKPTSVGNSSRAGLQHAPSGVTDPRPFSAPWTPLLPASSAPFVASGVFADLPGAATRSEEARGAATAASKAPASPLAGSSDNGDASLVATKAKPNASSQQLLALFNVCALSVDLVRVAYALLCSRTHMACDRG